MSKHQIRPGYGFTQIGKDVFKFAIHFTTIRVNELLIILMPPNGCSARFNGAPFADPLFFPAAGQYILHHERNCGGNIGIEIQWRVSRIFDRMPSMTFSHNSVVAGVASARKIHRLHKVYSYVE